MAPTWLWWSSGKDSAWTLHVLRGSPEHEVTALITTVSRATGRVSIHGVRRELLDAQARAAGLDLHVVELPAACSNAEYDAAIRPWLERAASEGVERMAFGDLHLEDVRAYREGLFAGVTIEPVFPIWGEDTRALAGRMLDAGIAARLTCVDLAALPAAFAGRAFDRALLDELPASVDPCGERGEFHTFAWSTPEFSAPVAVRVGEHAERGGFACVDLLPAAD